MVLVIAMSDAGRLTFPTALDLVTIANSHKSASATLELATALGIRMFSAIPCLAERIGLLA
jgi:hypothetical protein